MNDVYVISDQRSNRLVALPALDADALGQSLVPPAHVGRLSLPMGLCLDARRRLHVADFGNDRVVTLSFDTGTWTAFGAGLLVHPRDVTVDAGDRIYAVDGRQIVRVDTEDGLGAVVLPGLTAKQRPIAIAIDVSGRIFIVDAREQGLWFSDDDGGAWHAIALPDAELPSRPVSISARRDGSVLVSDLSNHRVVAFDGAGTAATVIAADDGLFFPASAIEDEPGITVLDAGPEWIRRFLPVGDRHVAADFVRGRRSNGTSRFERPAGLAIGAVS